VGGADTSFRGVLRSVVCLGVCFCVSLDVVRCNNNPHTRTMIRWKRSDWERKEEKQWNHL